MIVHTSYDSINQPINQPTNQSINKSTNQSTDASNRRCAVQFLAAEEFQWRCLMANWVKTRPEEEGYSDAAKSWLSDLLELVVPPCIRCKLVQ